jgi:hypothetical protein
VVVLVLLHDAEDPGWRLASGSRALTTRRAGGERLFDGPCSLFARDGEAVRLFTRRGYDWTQRYPAIAAAAAKLKARSFTLDGGAVVAGADGVAVSDALHRRGRVSDAILQACALLKLDGVDYRPLRRRGVPTRLRDGARVEAAFGALPVRPFPGLNQRKEPRQPGDGETSGGAMVALPKSGAVPLN